MNRQAQVWYTADLHVGGHKLVAGLRGFWNEDEVTGNLDLSDDFKPEAAPDTEEHDRSMAHVWDALVHPDDIVFILGDISINGSQKALDWVKARPGTKHLIYGNHDPVNPMNRNALKNQRRWLEVFETMNPFFRRRLGGVDVLLSHYPYWAWGDGPDRPEARYEQYRLPDLGLRLLHGHTHGTEKAHGSMFHVGWDAWGTLVPQSAILEWISETSQGDPHGTA